MLAQFKDQKAGKNELASLLHMVATDLEPVVERLRSVWALCEPHEFPCTFYTSAGGTCGAPSVPKTTPRRCLGHVFITCPCGELADSFCMSVVEFTEDETGAFHVDVCGRARCPVCECCES